MRSRNISTRIWIGVALSSLCSVSIPQTALAASSDECAIWLCLPTGFPSGCSGPKSAFKKRIKRMKSPLPGFNSCLVDAGTGMLGKEEFTAEHGVAAYIPSYEKCIRWSTVKRGRDDDHLRCSATIVTEPEYRKGQRCTRNRDGEYSNPANCTGTFRYTQVYRNGMPYGETYYY